MEKKDYLLTLRIPVKAVDHLEARHIVRTFLKESGMDQYDYIKAKLQLLHRDKEPEKVGL